MLKISGGKYIRQKIKIYESLDLRPTTSFLREWLFNVLQNYLSFSEASLLDLFAGSGIIGLEFMSRGTRKVTFVEKNSKVLAVLENNVKAVIKDEDFLTDYLKRDAFNFLKSQIENYQKLPYNVIFVDPPYKLEEIGNFVKIIDQVPEKLSDDFILIIESFYKTDLIIPQNLKLVKEKKSGQSKLSVFMK